MPRHRPPFRDARPYFNFDARVWIAAHRQGWTTAQIKTTLETIWVGSSIVRARYMVYKMNNPNARNSPGLPTPNPIPLNPYTVANLAASRISGRMPGVAAPGGVQAALPPPAPAPAPAPPTLVLGPIQSLALDPGPVAQQSTPIYPFDFWPEPRHWRDPSKWRDRLPREIRIHQLVDQHRKHKNSRNDYGKRDRKHLIKHYGHSLKMRAHRYRIYLKYYAGGDLDSAIEWHTTEKGEMQPTDIPEGFIWHVMESMTRACKVLQTGLEDSETLADEDKDLFKDWKPITHLDITLRNIFVEEVGDQQNPRPRLVLSDFGQAFYSLSAPPGATSPPTDNPWEYQIEGANTAWAPEHQEGFFDDPVPLGEKTDVWLIGSTAWMMMAGNPKPGNSEGPFGPQREDMEFLVPAYDYEHFSEPMVYDSFFRANTPYRRAAGYSQTLKTLVAECLHGDVDYRIGLGSLEREIDEFKRLPENAHIVNDMRPPPGRQERDFYPKRGVLPNEPLNKFRHFKPSGAVSNKPYHFKSSSGVGARTF